MSTVANGKHRFTDSVHIFLLSLKLSLPTKCSDKMVDH